VFKDIPVIMKVASLFSGGKDSAYAIYLAKKAGLNVKYIVSLFPEKKDSWMFHSINIHLTEILAEAMNIPFIKKQTQGEKEKELEDLKEILKGLEIDGVISGAIASEYQKSRIEKICNELGLKSFTPLWGKNQENILKDIIKAGFEIIIVGVFAEGLDESWLGRKLDEKTINELIEIRKKYLINEAGEGGEFETLVVDGPIFKKRLVLDEISKEWERDHGVLRVKKAHLE
jgi:predicted ATP pyrophosphatase (TIGR00289 family)